jgi:pimeloyl-ACP methyl ester carboxylesterase
MDIVLVPGLWLGAWSWERVVPLLEEAGHRAHPLTLPGLESREADRSSVGVAEQVAAVVAAIDQADAPVLLVGHSLGSAIAWGALDARVDRVARTAYVGGWPSPSGRRLAEGFATAGDDLPMPAWQEFDDADVRDLDEAARSEFAARAVPSPARLTTEALELKDDRRYAVPALFVCPEYTAEQLQQWVAGGEPSVAEIGRLADVSYADVPTGHWPQLTKPAELAAALLTAAT